MKGKCSDDGDRDQEVEDEAVPLLSTVFLGRNERFTEADASLIPTTMRPSPIATRSQPLQLPLNFCSPILQNPDKSNSYYSDFQSPNYVHTL